MSPEKLFARHPDLVYVRLGLEHWKELPGKETPEWETLVQMLKAACRFRGGGIYEVDHNGHDLYALLHLDLDLSIDAVVEVLRKLLRDAFWQPFIDRERFAWSGCYHAASVARGEKLTPPLEHPARTGKRRFMEGEMKRHLEHPWHEAPSPESVGVRFAHAVRHRASGGEVRVDLQFETPRVRDDPEAWAAAHLNTRIRPAGTWLLLDSIGWDFRTVCSGPSCLVFSAPEGALVETFDRVEIWWETDRRTRVAEVPCYEAGAEPEAL
jgi:hypothetical protein